MEENRIFKRFKLNLKKKHIVKRCNLKIMSEFTSFDEI